MSDENFDGQAEYFDGMSGNDDVFGRGMAEGDDPATWDVFVPINDSPEEALANSELGTPDEYRTAIEDAAAVAADAPVWEDGVTFDGSANPNDEHQLIDL